MKTQIDQVLAICDKAEAYLRQSFSVKQFKDDARLQALADIISGARRCVPTYNTGALIVEFDSETGRPRVNEKSAQDYISQQIETLRADDDWKCELDFVDSSTWDDVLISRMNGASDTEPPGVENPVRARFLLEGRRQMYLEKAKYIGQAMGIEP